jgi:hypothetical protein
MFHSFLCLPSRKLDLVGYQWLMPIITWETEIRRIEAWGQHRQTFLWDLNSKTTRAKWTRVGSSSRVPALQSQSPEFKPQSHKKKKKKKKKLLDGARWCLHCGMEETPMKPEWQCKGFWAPDHTSAGNVTRFHILIYSTKQHSVHTLLYIQPTNKGVTWLEKKKTLYSLFSVCVNDTGVCTQSLALARQTLCYFSHDPAAVSFVCF